VDRLSTILADPERSTRGGRVGRPSAAPDNLDEPPFAEDLTGLPEMNAEQLAAVVDRLVASESSVSADRRRLHETIDALRAELVRRYREGGADASDLFPRRTP